MRIKFPKRWFVLPLFGLLMAATAGANQAMEEHVLEVQWAPTEFSPLTLDNMISEKYCGYNEDRFLGCLAAIERFAQTTNLATEIQYVNNKFDMVANLKLRDLDFRTLQTHRRAKYNGFRKLNTAENLKSAIDLYTNLRKANANPKLYQSATAVNEAFAVIYDPHHMYQPLFKYDGLNQIPQKPYIGVVTRKVGNRVGIKAVYFNTAAEKAGVKPGDIILKVNGKDLYIQSEPELDQVMLFADKEKVNITFERKGRTFSADVIFSYDGLAKVVDRTIDFNGAKYAFLQMREVPGDLDPEGTCRVFAKILNNFQKTTQGMILDLRDNVGGPGDTAACLGALFVDKNKTMYIEQDMADVNSRSVEGSEVGNSFNKKLVVLVSAKTASSGELLTSAIQFYARGLVLGDRTYGKSIGQVTDTFGPQKYEEYVTVSKAFMPDGISYQTKGLTPDFFVFRDGLQPNQDEKAMLREEDLALFPLRLENRAAMVNRSKPMVFPGDCVKSDDVKKTFNSLADTDWTKDFQLQFALKTLSCMK